MDYKRLGELLDYTQPTEFIVETENYSDDYDTPVLTAGSSFILGYTDENVGVYHAEKGKEIILFDDFTTSSQWVDFDFKVKSSACKILSPKTACNLKYVYYAMKRVNIDTELHKRYWISIFSNEKIKYPSLNEQNAIVNVLDKIVDIINADKRQIKLLSESITSAYYEMIDASSEENYLGDFISTYTAKKCTDSTLPILSITKEFGIILQDEKFKKRIASVDVTKYKEVPFGILVQGIHIDERNFGIQDKVEKGLVSPAYKLWSVNEQKVIPELIAFALRTDRIMEYIKTKFTGSVKRRETISNKDFLKAKMNIPDKSKQLRFLGYMHKANEMIDKSRAHLNTMEHIYSQKLDEYFGKGIANV